MAGQASPVIKEEKLINSKIEIFGIQHINKFISRFIYVLDAKYGEKDIGSGDLIGNISKSLFNFDYTLNWIFGIFIAYMILKINDNDITKALRVLISKNDLVIVKLLIKNKEYVNDLRRT